MVIILFKCSSNRIHFSSLLPVFYFVHTYRKWNPRLNLIALENEVPYWNLIRILFCLKNKESSQKYRTSYGSYIKETGITLQWGLKPHSTYPHLLVHLYTLIHVINSKNMQNQFASRFATIVSQVAMHAVRVAWFFRFVIHHMRNVKFTYIICIHHFNLNRLYIRPHFWTN